MQIDVVSLRDDGWIDLGECKWGAVRSPAAVAEELAAKVGRYPNPRNATVQPRIFLRNRPARVAVPEGFRVHTLAELYGG